MVNNDENASSSNAIDSIDNIIFRLKYIRWNGALEGKYRVPG